MGDEVKEQPKQTSITDDLWEAGKHLFEAAHKTQDAEVKAAAGAGQYIAAHPTEAIVTATTGLGGLASYVVGKQIYKENEADLAPVVDAAKSAGSKMLHETMDFSVNSQKALANNIWNKPVTTIAETLICPVLPFFHASASALKDRLTK